MKNEDFPYYAFIPMLFIMLISGMNLRTQEMNEHLEAMQAEIVRLEVRLAPKIKVMPIPIKQLSRAEIKTANLHWATKHLTSKK